MEKSFNSSLKSLNTFGLDVKADAIVRYSSVQELRDVILSGLAEPVLAVGSGSNLLFLNDFHGTVLHSEIKSTEIVSETDASVLVRVGSGVIWDDFVAWTVSHGYWGAENLSAIPGTVGASAVQNIGAYGAEAADIIDKVECISLADGSELVLKNTDCNYSYRQSVFKNGLKGKYIVTYVTYRLGKSAAPDLGYGALKQRVEALGKATLENIRKAVMAIRAEKLPDPAVLGNAGSFFVNPVIPEAAFLELKRNYPDIPSYAAGIGLIKVPAGWLIEQSGWKGRALGPAAVHDRQALVLVNRGGASGSDIKALADAIIKEVKDKFGITLNTEVNYI